MTNFTADQYRDEDDGTDARTTFEFDCDHCEEVLRTATMEAMQSRGTAHLESHQPTLLEVFADKDRGKHCRNECGYRFPSGEEVTGFVCPECGYDNFPEFAHRYLYWQVEYP